MVSEGPVATGSRVARVAGFLGQRFRYVNEVTELTRTTLVMHTIEAPFPMRITYGFADDGDATRFSVRVQGNAGGFYGMLSPLLSMAVRKSIERDVGRLRRVLERKQR
jgi:hypothetical protein